MTLSELMPGPREDFCPVLRESSLRLQLSCSNSLMEAPRRRSCLVIGSLAVFNCVTTFSDETTGFACTAVSPFKVSGSSSPLLVLTALLFKMSLFEILNWENAATKFNIYYFQKILPEWVMASFRVMQSSDFTVVFIVVWWVACPLLGDQLLLIGHLSLYSNIIGKLP